MRKVWLRKIYEENTQWWVLKSQTLSRFSGDGHRCEYLPEGLGRLNLSQIGSMSKVFLNNVPVIVFPFLHLSKAAILKNTADLFLYRQSRLPNPLGVSRKELTI